MAEEVRLWKIENRTELRALTRSKLDLEERLEGLLGGDVSVLADDLLVIGRQTQTEFGGYIDLLCLDRNGDVVIVELKRDKTPREITAQTLDYASWVRDLSREAIVGIAQEYVGQRGLKLDEAFQAKFGSELPEVLNENHRMLIVASAIDASSERIINYLSDQYGVDINAVTFHYFRTDEDQEFLARIFLIQPEAAEHKAQTKGGSKRRRHITYEELEEQADQTLNLAHPTTLDSKVFSPIKPASISSLTCSFHETLYENKRTCKQTTACIRYLGSISAFSTRPSATADNASFA